MKKITEFISKKGRVIEIVEPTMELLSQLINFYKRLTEEDAMINRYENLQFAEEEKGLIRKIEEIKAGNRFVIFAVFENKIISYCNVIRVGGRSRHMGNLGVMVDKDFRQEGIGQFLMAFVLKKALKMKIKIVTLDSFINNEPAINLYQKLGFQEYGRLPKALLWRGQYYDEIRMYKEI